MVEANTIRPRADFVLIKRTEAKDQTKTGLYIPERAKERPVQGTIIAVGPGKLDKHGNRIPMELKVGDEVSFGRYTGTEIIFQNAKHILVEESEVIGIIERKAIDQE